MGVLLCCLSALLYGLNAVLIKLASEDLSVPLILCFRGGLAVLLLALPMRRRKISVLPASARQGLLLALHTFCGFILTTVLLNMAYLCLPVGAVTTIHYLYPLLVYLGSALFWKVPFTWRVLPILLAVLVGATLLAEPTGLGGNGLGVLLAVASSVTWAFHMLCLEHTPLRMEPPLRLVFWQGSMSIVVGMAAQLLTEGRIPIPDPASLGVLLCSALCALIGAGTLLSLGIRRIGSGPASVLSVFEPVGSILFGLIFLRELPTPRQWLGILVILSAVLALLIMRSRETARNN